MSEDFSQDLVKEYKYWGVYVHRNQCFLGRCVIWCKRNDALDLADATKEEREELFIILFELREATKKVFQPDWFNYSFLGNETRHLHGHFVPRYAKPKTFYGVTFEDGSYGHHYRTDHDFIVDRKVLNAIRDKLKEVLR